MQHHRSSSPSQDQAVASAIYRPPQVSEPQQKPREYGLFNETPSPKSEPEEDNPLNIDVNRPTQNFNAPKPMSSSRMPMNSYLPVVEEPICVLKIELDGENIEEIKVFENDDP